MRRFPLIVDVKRCSLEDGPGIRSVVFFKGCPLRCIFCQNPETQDPEPELAFSEKNCIHCGRCADVCPEGAVDLDFSGRIHRDRCVLCGKCADVCPGNGLRLIGRTYAVEDLLEVLLRDLPFYRHSGGGVTLAGGECTLYPDYLQLLLKALKAENTHVVLETSGYFDYRSFEEKILPHVDLLYYDVKIADPDLHKKHLGRTNTRILRNLFRLLQERPTEIHPRVPIVPGITATMENLSAIVDLLCAAGAEKVTLLPYNPLGFEMASSLGKPRPALPASFMKPDEERDVFAMFSALIEEKRKGA
jgi:pyruvate formate lyase activating enzyme